MKEFRKPHAFNLLSTPAGDVVQIDRQLVPIIEWCWDNGLTTTHCCQGDAEIEGYISLVGRWTAEAVQRHWQIDGVVHIWHRQGLSILRFGNAALLAALVINAASGGAA